MNLSPANLLPLLPTPLMLLLIGLMASRSLDGRQYIIALIALPFLGVLEFLAAAWDIYKLRGQLFTAAYWYRPIIHLVGIVIGICFIISWVQFLKQGTQRLF